MDFWKTHGRQAAVALAFLVLAMALTMQGTENRRLKEKVRGLTAAVESLEGRLEQVGDDLLTVKEEQTAIGPLAEFLGYSVRKMDLTAGTITLEITFERGETEPSCVAVRFGGDAKGPLRAYGDPVSDENGVYAYTCTLPLALDAGGAFVLLAGDGVEERTEVLYRFDSVLDLLPVRAADFSGEIAYDKAGNGKAYLAHQTVKLADGMGYPAVVPCAEFQVLLNGKPVLSAEADSHEAGSYSGGLEGRGFPCQPGDQVELRFACTDAFGLRYTFPLTRWNIISSGKTQELWPSSAYPTVIWPE